MSQRTVNFETQIHECHGLKVKYLPHTRGFLAIIRRYGVMMLPVLLVYGLLHVSHCSEETRDTFTSSTEFQVIHVMFGDFSN